MLVTFDTFDKYLSSFVGNYMKMKSINEKTKSREGKGPTPSDFRFFIFFKHLYPIIPEFYLPLYL